MIRRAVHSALRAVPDGVWVPILSGPARGWMWEHNQAHLGFTTGGYERHVQRAIRTWMPKDGVFLDIGAHWGFHSVVALAAGAGHVAAFEPDHENSTRILRWSRVNGVSDRVALYLDAASDENGKATMYHWPAGDSMHGRIDRELPPWLWGSLPITRPARKVRIDGEPLVNPDVVKIDVEGHEEKVIRGAMDLLSTAEPVVIWTVHGDTFEPCRKLLEESLGVNVRFKLNGDTYLSVPMRHYGGSYANRPDGIRGPVPEVRV